MDSDVNKETGSSKPLTVLVLLLMMAGIGWQLFTGRIVSRRFNSSTIRTDSPWMFWSLLGIDVAVALLFCVVVYRTFRRKGA